MGWANRITLGRAVLTAILWGMLAGSTPSPSTGLYWAAFLLFAFTALTDAVDGIVARRFGEVSVFGRIADPLVDKLLVLGTMVILLGLDGIPDVLPPWTVTLMLAREFLVTALRGAVEGKGISFQAMPLGKAKMIVQSVAAGLVLLYGAGLGIVRREIPGLSLLPGEPGTWNLAHAFVWLALLLTVVSGVDYTIRAARLLSRA